MSETSSRVTERHFEYIRARTLPEEPFFAELKREAKEAGIPAIWIAPEQAAFMRILLAATGAREVVEVGTLAGLSAIAMALALPEGGRVRTIEIVPAHADFAERWVEQSPARGKVTVHRGAGSDVLRTFGSDSADAAFLDADKGGYPAYLEECLRIVRPGGLILADNAFAFGQLLDDQPKDREVAAVRAFNDHIAREPRVEGIIVPVGDGLWVARRKR